MRSLLTVVCWLVPGLALAASAFAAPPCSQSALGVARILEIDTAGGPVFGSVTRLDKEASFLKRNEVVLTFDDGPMPGVTRPILDVLDRFCVKATFFPVGRMALAHPDLVKEVAARGHTLGSHTWSHPKLRELPVELAGEEVERGFAAVALAAGRPIAPFFRFPGLGDSELLLPFLQLRAIATFTVDVISNDSFIADPEQLAQTALAAIEARHGGIVLFHDIKPQTATALPIVLATLKERGYRIVHLRAKTNYEPPSDVTASLRRLLATEGTSGRPAAALDGLGDDGGSQAPLARGRHEKRPEAAEPSRPNWAATVLRRLNPPDVR
ncbi:MAG TPA: polysaccharide deacetylase family protein [Hyphomicrobiaceae bacterium]|nr:polysaccharide deacetylase family protein [Hyphomicrobiaceae bacterium]